MNSLSFLNSPLLWGISLAAIPLIIHLLFRRRFRRIEWAPMRYLKLSIERNRRRIQLEQLLLLLARMLLVALLMLIVARPVMHAEGLGKWLSGRAAVSRILLFDDSMSMQLRDRGESAFDRARVLSKKLLDDVGPKDRFTLATTSAPAAPLLREVELTDRDSATRMIEDLAPSETFVAWQPALTSVDKLLQSGTYPIRHLTIVTDLRRAGWEKGVRELAERWAGEHVDVRIFDVGRDSVANVALTSLTQIDRLAVAGSPVQFEALIRNDSSGELRELEANWVVEGAKTLVRLPSIEAGGQLRLPLTAVFAEAGARHAELQLPDDDLLADNIRAIAVDVQQTARLMLVDGEPSSEPLGGEVDFLALAMSLSAADAEAFQIEVVTDAEWSGMGDVQPDLLVLANVATIGAEQAARLKRLVSQGMGLMIFPGDQVDPDSYNNIFGFGPDGLLPAEFEAIADEETSGLVLEEAELSPLEALRQLSPAVLERIKIRKVLQVKTSSRSPKGLRVLARWNNATASPAAIERSVGRGRVLLWTVAADKAWSDWPTDPSYVLAMREAAKAVARTSGVDRTFTAGDSVRRALPAGREITQASVEAPHAKGPASLQVETSASSSAAAGKNVPQDAPAKNGSAKTPRELVLSDTRRAGLYKLSWHDSSAGGQNDIAAVNSDARECALSRMALDDAKTLWQPLNVEVIDAAGERPQLAAHGEEIWRNLALGLLGLVVFEACFATWTGRQR